MDYLTWNDAIGARFFNLDRSGIRVFFYVTTDIVNEIGASADADLGDFLSAVKTGSPWNTRHGQGICQQALQTLQDWRARDLNYPPYLGYLALFVMADTIDVGFARHSYYPGLRHLLGEEPETGMYPSFNQMHRLWDDLAVWSNQDRHGEWGIFDADIVGEWMHVGLPRAQTLLTDEERENLPFLFADNSLDPHSPPLEGELSYLLADDTHHYLRHQTKELLRSTSEGNASIRAALIEVLLDELERWDGSVPARPEAGEQIRNSLGNLRLAMTFDRTAKTVRFYLRCRSNREYPEEGLQLIGEHGTEPLYCYEDWQGWSTLLYETETQISFFDASRLDWRAGLTLADPEHAWRTSLSKSSVRVMVSAAPFGFDGFLEESQIPQGKLFYLLAHNDHAYLLQTWGRECCTGFSEVELVSGVPRGWRLYFIERAESDAIIRDTLPFLSFPAVLRIQLRGGLKVQGSQYFMFALPYVEVTGVDRTVDVFCNNHPLEAHPETGLYTIPEDVRSHRLIVEVRRDGECIRRKSLYALETLAWCDTVPTAHFNKFGRRIDGEANESYVGPIVEGFTSPEFSPEVFLPPSAGNRIYFIGRNPGEIVECPKETIPEDWKPVWAVAMKKGKGNAIYCGTVPLKEEPTRIRCTDQKRQRLWQKVLWYWRKRISYPSQQALCTLWKKYREEAQRVC